MHVLAETWYVYSYQLELHLYIPAVMRPRQEYNIVLSKIHVTEVYYTFSRIIHVSPACHFHWTISFPITCLIRNSKMFISIPLYWRLGDRDMSYSFINFAISQISLWMIIRWSRIGEWSNWFQRRHLIRKIYCILVMLSSRDRRLTVNIEIARLRAFFLAML